ncbi:MAG: hypothetical protein AB1767_04270 [Bacillota bacterium]
MQDHTVTGLIFSKDRAMQLEAVFSSLSLHCRDRQNLQLKVLYTVSGSFHEDLYHMLSSDYGDVEFIRENDFKPQVLSSLETGAYVLFLVDDAIFVRDFTVENVTAGLENNTDALGFSLRLGSNTVYCYSRDIAQKLPEFSEAAGGFLKYDWSSAEGDFGYPLEISSSVYRIGDILPLLRQLGFANPNTLEGRMAAHKHIFMNRGNYLLCSRHSIAFCSPVNMVQNVWPNRAGSNPQYTVDQLGRLFELGYRINVAKYSGYLPNACHQEVDLIFSNAEGLSR